MPDEWPFYLFLRAVASVGPGAKQAGPLLREWLNSLPPGREWYAKRFAWEPADTRRPSVRPRGRAPAHAR